ncbi:hypothetical protein KKF61_07940 [Patescibacteria group bacterium]|nr:hypothetical protein [Patescibacteria group bacterium]
MTFEPLDNLCLQVGKVCNVKSLLDLYFVIKEPLVGFGFGCESHLMLLGLKLIVGLAFVNYALKC